ncbi:MAG TPA: LysR family transcriptional regulator [Noviherbaspirillum sp.]|uniref:LysR family transcriptional regulator n=1 Tax=Noviherbaspirillum sp. TaxID=1926288 RepID=UPI002B494366|nr:LysR family transcriptional regulator [Noviherbaspirillum sp.]HJV85412.1 LysR family transcriptional regulator [Noviherbaspirillum sp.]
MHGNVSDLRLFVTMVDAGSISAAARILNSSPPAVSRRLATLEARLGIRLITRTSRHFEPTDEGRVYYERGVCILKQIEDAESEATLRAKKPCGQLKVGAPMGLGRRYIAPMIERFNVCYPDISVHLVLSDAGWDVLDDSLDVAIRVGLPPDTSIIARKLIEQRRIVCASPSYLDQFGTPQTPEDLVRHNCIRLVRGADPLDNWQFSLEGQKRGVRVSGTFTTTSSEVVSQWAAAGKGIGLLALWDIQEHLETGTLKECLTEYWCDVIELYAIFVHRQHLPLRIRMFVDFIAKEFRSFGAQSGWHDRTSPDKCRVGPHPPTPLDIQKAPYCVDPPFDLVVHDDGSTPFAV